MTKFQIFWTRDNKVNGVDVVQAEDQNEAKMEALRRMRRDTKEGFGFYDAQPV